MQALRFHYSLPRLAFARLFGMISARAFVSRAGPFYMEDIMQPTFHAHDWVIVRTCLAGICGSDAKQVFLEGAPDNPLTSLISFPQVLGHEAVGIVERVGPGVTKHQVGDRVVLNPWLSCTPRGIQPICDACLRGEYYLCAHFTDSDLPPGIHAGNCSAVPGTFAPLFSAHESQLFPIPDSVSFEQAVFADPFSVSLHAVLKAPPKNGSPSLVYGCGTLGLLTILILKSFYPDTEITAVARYPQQEVLAREIGAHHVMRTDHAVEVVERVAKIVGAPTYQPWSGLPMLLRGVEQVYDTVGSA